MKIKKEPQETKNADVSLNGAEIPTQNAETVKAPGKRKGRPKATKNREPAAEPQLPVSPIEGEGNTGNAEPTEPTAEPQPSAAEPPMVPAETASAAGPYSVEPLTKEQLKLEYRKRTGIIKEQLTNIQQSFLVIAFQLYWIKENVMYPSAYKNIYEFADVEYGISRSTCGNLIYIVDTYAERDDAGRVLENLREHYRDFSASQLVAMAGLPEEVRENVKPDMSVRMINRMRKQEAQARLGSGKDADAPAEKDTVETGADDTAPERKESAAPQAAAAGEQSAGEASGPADDGTGMAGGSPTGTDNPAARSIPSATGTEAPDTGNANKTSGAAQAQPEPKPAKSPDAQQDNLKVFSTLLSFNSYSRYEKEQKYLSTLIKNVFDDNAGAVTVKVIYEKEPA